MPSASINTDLRHSLTPLRSLTPSTVLSCVVSPVAVVNLSAACLPRRSFLSLFSSRVVSSPVRSVPAVRMLLWLVAFVFLFARADACGCYGCFYTEQSACARCCTAFIKRSGAPAPLPDRPLANNIDGSLIELVRRLDAARHRNPSPSFRADDEDFTNDDRVRRPIAPSTFVRRDTCGCSMGCFFEEATECARCCSQALRRNTNAIQRSQAEQGLADILGVFSKAEEDNPLQSSTM